MSVEIVIFCGAVAGGFVSGLTGFGTGLTALALWLLVVPPVVAAPLVVICSIIAQLQTLPAIWRAIDWGRVWPFLVGGLVGIPIGVELLLEISSTRFKAVIGALLIGYCILLLLRRSAPLVRGDSRWLSGLIGIGGGVLGGFAGLSGILPSVWATLKHWRKDEARSVFQTFNLTILTASAISMASQDLLTSDFANLAAIALPGTILGAWFGRRLYNRLSDERFGQVILALLLLAGASLLTTSLAR